MHPWWSGSTDLFLRTSREAIVGQLAAAQQRHFRSSETQQLRGWEDSIDLLARALRAQPDARTWHVLLEYPMLRLGRRADAILLTGRATVVLEFKIGATRCTPGDRRQAEDYAIDLYDFHAGARRHPIVPILVATHAALAPAQSDLPIHGVRPPIDANAASLAGLLRMLADEPASGPELDVEAWLVAPYRPVPTIVEAACMLYARHGVADIHAARADTTNLSLTTDAILAEIDAARVAGRKLALFVTGIPGAGKTLCGMNAAFGAPDATRATFLTGNPTLVHVLREALVRDATKAGADRRAATQKMEGVIQRLPDFRNTYVTRSSEIPAERIVVIDEAQRCWSRNYAVAKTRDRSPPLRDSEPGHLLEIMGRHAGFAAIVCLVGGGQEIHDGEGGLAEWGTALRASGDPWLVRAAPDVVGAGDLRHCLGRLPDLRSIPALHLGVSVRQQHGPHASAWVDHVLAGRADAAADAAADQPDGNPFLLTRSLRAMRIWLRSAARGHRRAGLLASSGGRRLRANGLGAELPHMDAKAVAHWFLDRFPADIRASDALELVATEFSCQGLELDYVGLCWDGDLIREPGRTAWRARRFRGTAWTYPAGAEAIANRINTYRVLLTRARYETVILVPRGDADDPTRSPAIYNAVAAYLRDCGARDLPADTPHPPAALPEPALLL